MRPGSRPIEALADAFFARVQPGNTAAGVPTLPELAEGDFTTPAELAAILRKADETAVRPILRALERIEAQYRKAKSFTRAVRTDLLLVVDQLDDLFAADVSAAERASFAKLLRALVTSKRVWLVATLRATLYEAFLNKTDLKALKESGADYDLAPPGPAELVEIVQKPAKAAALVYERDAQGEALDEKLLRHAGGDTLPLLQFVLQRLFEARQIVDNETRLTNDAYIALGGIDGAIDQAAEEALGELGVREVEALTRRRRYDAAARSLACIFRRSAADTSKAAIVVILKVARS
jgi:hypothetical protein